MEARGKHVATSFIEQRPRSLRFVDPSGILKKIKSVRTSIAHVLIFYMLIHRISVSYFRIFEDLEKNK